MAVEILGYNVFNGGQAKDYNLTYKKNGSFEVNFTVESPDELEPIRQKLIKKHGEKYSIFFIPRIPPGTKGDYR